MKKLIITARGVNDDWWFYHRAQIFYRMASGQLSNPRSPKHFPHHQQPKSKQPTPLTCTQSKQEETKRKWRGILHGSKYYII